MSLRKRLFAIVSHPATQLLIGVTTIGCGLAELFTEVGEVVKVGEGGPTSAHGVVLFGLVHAVKSLLELVEGIERIGERSG